MTIEESLQILDNCLKQLEDIPEDEMFDYFYNNSPSFKKEIDRLKEKGEVEYRMKKTVEFLRSDIVNSRKSW